MGLELKAWDSDREECQLAGGCQPLIAQRQRADIMIGLFIRNAVMVRDL